MIASPMTRASSIPGELIPRAWVWLEPGITPCVKTRKIEKSRECFFLDQLKPNSLGNVCATIGDLDERFFCRAFEFLHSQDP